MLPADKEIVIALNSGDENMFEMVFRHYYEPLCRYANQILNDGPEAEEVVQQTMIRLWEKRTMLEINISLKSYLYRAIHNTALNKIRGDKVRSRYAGEVMASGENHALQASHKIQTHELEHAIQVAINKLPEQCRLVFKLSRFEQMTYAEIAGTLNISVKTVENQMGKALRLMRENLKEFMIWIILAMPWLLP